MQTGGLSGIRAKKNPTKSDWWLNLTIFEWLPRRDSNPNKQNQNLRCYHYTTRHPRLLRLAGSTGLEPATPGSTVQCANQLRHNPVAPKRIRVVYQNFSIRVNREIEKCLVSSGGGSRIRTGDILLAKQTLYQLSYTPLKGGGSRWNRTIDLVLIRDAL